MRARTLLAMAAIASACTTHESEPVAVGVNASFVVPQDILASISSVQLQIFDTAPPSTVDCDATSGMAINTTGVTPLATPPPLMSTGCVLPAKFCGSVQIPEASTDRVFWAIGANSSGANIASGCTRQTINQSAEPLSITMLRVLPTAVCGDNVIEPTETCDTGIDDASYCASGCQSKEVLLSVGATANGTKTGTANTKTNAFFLWPNLTGASGQFLALFNDATSGDGADIGVRALQDSWIPLTSALAKPGEFFLPDGSVPPGEPMASGQSGPSAVLAASTYYVVFKDAFPSNADIHLRSMDTLFNAGQAVNSAITINGLGAGEAGTQSAPSIAASPDGSSLFIAWEDGTGGPHVGTIQGVLYTPTSATAGTFSKTQQTISTETPSTGVSLASIGSAGYVAVWESGVDIHVRVVAPDGSLSGGELTLPTATGTRDHPSVAALPDGSFAIVYAQHASATSANVMLLRYGANQAQIAGDPVVVNNLSTGNETLPRVAAMTAVGGSYAITWLDGTQNIRGRFAANGANGATGFLFNTVDGQDNEFPANGTPTDNRTNPIVVSGGASGSVIFGWEDTSSTTPGIIGRHFPAPTQ